MSDTLPSEIDSATSIPDIREQTLGDVAPAALSILRRVLKKTGATVPVAAFQSSI
jgi:FXSXX-COOH protein